MQLLIDVGNTRLKWAWVDQARLRDWHPCDTLENGIAWQTFGEQAHGQWPQLRQDWQGLAVTRCLVSNVAADAVQIELEALLFELFPHLELQRFRSQANCAGVQNQYERPTQLGSDRFACAIAAQALFPDQDKVVATCGTATTVDAVNQEAHFLGGMILPGLLTMATSLAKNTAQLPQVAQDLQVNEVFARHTDGAIMSGCLHAQTGAILSAVLDRQGQANAAVCVVLSGGAAPYIAPLLAPYLQQRHVRLHIVDNLVLTGLFVVAQSQLVAASAPHS